ncbi:hypothetical protein [Silvimonas iriomotensis]|uniref:Type 4 fimbrial biogenesis protein PilX N-terminal domain-containing protein n=1 Tax=Silvimonas iriomotensis TaxID=449662 RepID=A0ABQ2P7Z7_9NEIS|nr:hypothetical protein [Silvimonas iriomotensis]GGP20480.1 hypothetical protein GCM10010970_15420 [Silvimonas iriomotensis]
MRPRPLHFARIHTQRGIAAILLVLMVGLSLSAAVLGTMYYVHSEQDSALTAHSATQAQLKAWTGVEAFRQYLYQAGQTGASALTVNSPISLTGLPGISGLVAAVSNTSTSCVSSAATGSVQGTLVTANLTGSSGGATSTVQAIYCVIAGSAGSSNSITNAINFNHDVTLGGSINFTTSTSTAAAAVINVNGSFTATSISLTGVQVINATGNVAIGSSAQVGTINSNGTVALSGSASAVTINAIGDVTLTGSAHADSVNTKGSVTMDSNSIGTLKAQKNLTVTSSGTVTTGTIGGTLSKPSWNNGVNVTVQSNYTVPVNPVSLTSQQIDANQLQSVANYIFDVDSSGYRKVTVANVNGITNGTYYLGNYDSTHVDYLCTALASGSTASSPTCGTPAVGSAVTICKGYSTSNTCFSYNTSTSMWSINGTSIAQGVAWFHGDLTVGNGTYYNTFIATGNISTSGSDVVYAPAYAGYNGVVNGTTYAPTGICVNNNFASRWPTNLCTPAASPTTFNYSATAVANYAFLAGSATNGVYSGGNVSLGSSTVVYGSILANNQFNSNGSTTVYGYVTASGSTAANSLGASTTINLSALPPAYQPGAGVGTGGGSSAATAVTSKVLWTRYL